MLWALAWPLALKTTAPFANIFARWPCHYLNAGVGDIVGLRKEQLRGAAIEELAELQLELLCHKLEGAREFRRQLGIKLGDELERIGYKGKAKAGSIQSPAMLKLHTEPAHAGSSS